MSDRDAILSKETGKSLLRFMTCGSVDDGKSTLIGRLLFDTSLILEDQLATLQRDSAKYGTTDGDIDFALLVDGLEAEREQGITIDVAYRFFSTLRRKYIVADAPGHEEYTRNMATAASTADLAVILVDSRRGILPQTRRHAYIASLLGVRHIVLAVNKIDLVDYDQSRFNDIVNTFRQFARNLSFSSICSIPISARYGENVATESNLTPWYGGPSLLQHLESVEVEVDRVNKPFRMPVQLVTRPNPNFRGFAGEIAAGKVEIGDQIVVASSGQISRVAQIVTMGGNLVRADAGQAVTLVLEGEIDVSRGCVLSDLHDRPKLADQFQAKVVWFDTSPLIPGRSYILRTEVQETAAAVTALKYQINVESFAHEASKVLRMNEVGVCNISTQQPITFDPYSENRSTGNFILIDRMTNATSGAGMIDFPLRRADNVHWQSLAVNKKARAALKGQRPVVLWFTGLSGSGKSTIANALEKMLLSKGKHTYMIDGDNIRHGLNRDLGFTVEDRVENVRRTAEVARLFIDAGLIVLVCLISPFRSERRVARSLFDEGEFIEIFIDTPLDVCSQRDPKGLYKRAFAGDIANFTGVSSPYEPPEHPDLHIYTVENEPLELARSIEDYVLRMGHD